MAKATPPDSGGEMETVTSADGTEIAFARTGSGPPLVLVHGIALDHGFWELSDLRSALAEENTVYAIDRRGRGGSGDAEEYALEREFEDVAAVVDSIDEPVTLLGHSFGALIALEAAAKIDTLQRLVLYDPVMIEADMTGFEQLLGAVQSLLADGEKEQALVTNITGTGLPERFLEDLQSTPSWQALVDAADTILREAEAFMQYEFDADRFMGMKTPTLLLSGEESLPGHIEGTETVAETLPDSRIVRMDGVGHYGLVLKADRFVEKVLAFRHES